MHDERAAAPASIDELYVAHARAYVNIMRLVVIDRDTNVIKRWSRSLNALLLGNKYIMRQKFESFLCTRAKNIDWTMLCMGYSMSSALLVSRVDDISPAVVYMYQVLDEKTEKLFYDRLQAKLVCGWGDESEGDGNWGLAAAKKH